MFSDLLSPFLELENEFCKNFSGLETTDGLSVSLQQQHNNGARGFQRRHSLCPVTLLNSKFNAGGSEADEAGPWAGAFNADADLQWNRDGRLPRSSLSSIPFRVDRSVSMIEGGPVGAEGGEEGMAPPPPRHVLLPPPGLSLSCASLSSSSASSVSKPLAPSPPISTRYKTELCRTYEESGTCKYGAKCQFAHGMDELRGLNRHPKYKTEPCRTFHTVGFCPYGARCHFIHNADELQTPATEDGGAPPQRAVLRPPLLRHSFSFAGFSSSSPQTPASAFQPAPSSQLSSSLLFSRASSISPPLSATGSPELLSPLFPEPGLLKHCSYPFSGLADLAGDCGNDALRFYAATDSAVDSKRHAAAFSPKQVLPRLPLVGGLGGLQRCSSADSLSEEGYTSSCSLSSSSGSESPCFEGRRLPIFSRLSVTDD